MKTKTRVEIGCLTVVLGLATTVAVCSASGFPAACQTQPSELKIDYAAPEQAGYTVITDHPSGGHPASPRFTARVRRDAGSFATTCDVTIGSAYLVWDKNCSEKQVIFEGDQFRIEQRDNNIFALYLADKNGAPRTYVDEHGVAQPAAWDQHLKPQIVGSAPTDGYAWLTNEADPNKHRWTYYVYLVQKPSPAQGDKFYVIEYWDANKPSCNDLKPPTTLSVNPGLPTAAMLENAWKKKIDAWRPNTAPLGGGSGQGGVGGGGEPPPHQ